MRIKTLGLLTLFTALAAGTATTAYAQDLHVTADIGFAFKAGEKAMPAGHYDFTEIGSDGGAIHVAGTTPRAPRPSCRS